MVRMEKKLEKVIGTNCYNCLFVADQEKAVVPKELNAEGGIDPKNKDELERAKKADLITLPGGSKTDATTKRYCNNDQIEMYVTVRMCCAYWDNAGVKRPWKSN
jgi:hypothetical protein